MAKRCGLLILFLVFFVVTWPASAQSSSSRAPITPENAAQVALLNSVGGEQIIDLAWSPGGSLLAANTSFGAALFNPNNLNEAPHLLRDAQFAAQKYYSYGGGNLTFIDHGVRLIAAHDVWIDCWDVALGTGIASTTTQEIETYNMAFEETHQRLVFGGVDVNRYIFLGENHELCTPGLPSNIDLADYYFVLSGEPISSAAFSPDGQFMALATAELQADCRRYICAPSSSDIRVWSVARALLNENILSRQPIDPDLLLQGHTAPVRQVVYNADGTLLASASLDGTARLWLMPDGIPGPVLTGHLAPVWDIDFAPDGQQVVTASLDGTLRLWDAATGEALWTMAETKVAMGVVAFSPHGERIAVAGRDGSLWMFDAATGEILDQRAGRQSIWCAAFNSDGHTLATGNDANEVVLWDVLAAEPTAVVRQVLQGHTGPVYDVTFSPDGTRIASASSDHTVRLWDARTGEALMTLEGHTSSVYGLAFSPNGRLLASGSWDRTARLWDATSGELLQTLEAYSGVYSLAFSPDGRLLAYGDTYLWDIEQNRLIGQWETYHGWSDRYAPPIGKLVFSEDGQYLINGGYIYGNMAWNLVTLDQVTDLASYSVMAVRGNLLAFGETLNLFDLTTKQLLKQGTTVDPRHTASLTRDVAFSPDGTLIVMVGTNGVLNFWGLPTADESYR